MKNIFLFFVLFFYSAVFLNAGQVVIDNFDDSTWTTLYGKGEIALTSDNDETVPGSTIISKNFDAAADHTSGSGYAVRVDYTIDSYGGIYFVFTSDPATYSYINGYTYKKLSLYLKADATTYNWRMELKDYNGQKCNFSLGKISTEWTKYEFDMETYANVYNNVNFTNLNSIVLINTNGGSSGKLYVDDIVFDDMSYVETSSADKDTVSFSSFKINSDNQDIRIKITPFEDSKISINIASKSGETASKINTGDFYYQAKSDAVFTWTGSDENNKTLRNGIYMVVIKITTREGKQNKIVKPIVIVR